MPRRNNILEDEEFNLVNNDLTAEDLAIIAAGLQVLGDLFAFYSLLKEREDTEKKGKKKKS
ncbi:hypothetical protein [Paenibacillus segetis]|uniref:Uncharacterized protein n=1 Tax=Paenibacillus segetis TaxID=1325360 RepID=A0ABQ1Y847_9BACL|nr:hypothetical protein [Paenibacillus segetis]GGH14891.1 hypothetical protein GCM10008013_08790 [Paenibacillus segetis]